MARLPLVLLACVFLASALAAPVAIISAAAKFRDLTPSDVPDPDENYKWLRYVTNSTWEPANMRWDCSTTPGICSGSTCGTSSATGPWCRNPTVPSNAPYGLDLDRFPWQVRWGEPAGVGVSNGVGIPSGFGFRGTYNYGASNIYETFWVGEAVHFNNVIYDYGANRWTLVITLFITANSVTTTQDFAYSLRLDETLNDCSSYGCPWQSNWWASNPTADTRPDCPALTPEPRLPNGGPNCCRYYTIKDRQCADRVWTLDALDQTKSITVNGRPYTLNIKGFSLPNDPSTQKDYFISQERGKTYAEIYGNLVDACPAISSCPPGQRLVVQGTSCVCTCPDNSPCPTGQARNSTCQCNCLPSAVQCNGGTVRTSGTSCVCDCAGASCTAPKIVDSADFCKCKCPANICNAGTVSNPNDPNCPCSCPACPVPGQVADSRCNCACPAAAATQCTTQGGTYDTATCTCSVPCICPETACKTLQSCSTTDGICRYNFNVNVSCDAPNADLCLAKCGPAGECVFDAVDCSAQVNLTAKYGATDAQCWSVACNPATGGCVETFHEEQACSLDLTAEGANAPCKTSVCRTVAGVSACIAIPNTAVEGTPCVLPTDDQCNAGACAAGVCVNNPKVLQPCSDGSGCTFLDNFVDPVTSKNTDACLLDPQDPTKAKCTANRTICDRIAVACNSVTCVDTPAGSFCELTPLPYGTACDDGTKCTVNDICQQELVVDEATGAVVWQANGICEGVSAQCNTDNPCMVGRCIEGGGCEYRADVRQGFICGVSEDNCTVFRCDNGTCVASEDVCPAGTSRTGAIIGATIAGAAAILAAAAVALWARSRIAESKVFDPNTWDQLQAGAGDNNPLYHAKTNERVNALYGN